jgi:hypothetical protein
MDTYHEGQEVMVATPAGKSQWSKATIVRVMQGPDFDQDWFVVGPAQRRLRPEARLVLPERPAHEGADAEGL